MHSFIKVKKLYIWIVATYLCQLTNEVFSQKTVLHDSNSTNDVYAANLYLCRYVLTEMHFWISGNTILAHAEEDELDDVVDIEGEDNQVVGDDVLGNDDDSIIKSSQDVDTTILFIKPVPSYGDNVFGEIFWLYYCAMLIKENMYRCKFITYPKKKRYDFK